MTRIITYLTIKIELQEDRVQGTEMSPDLGCILLHLKCFIMLLNS